MKKLKIAGITLVVLAALAFSVPFIFKGRILTLTKEELNKSLNAKVEFKDLGLSLFRHFPNLSVKFDEMSIVGLDEFSNDTLISAVSLDASVNLWSLIRGNTMKVSGIYLESPRIHALVNESGKANWDIAKEDTITTGVSADTNSGFVLSLQKYKIKNGYVLYRDESNNMSAEIINLDHEGSGNFTQDIFTLSTKTRIATTSFTYDNIPFLIKAKTNIDADIQVDNRSNKYNFKNGDILVNNLKLVADGFFQLINDSTFAMDISFNSPSTDFKDILSLVPGIYKNNFDKLKTGGKTIFNGFVRGVYSPKKIPAYHVDLEIKDGFFQYPELPKPVKNIQVTMNVNNPDGIPDHAVVDITKAHLEIDNEPFDFRLLFKNPGSSKYIDGAIKGRLNLADVSKFVKLDPGTKLAGLLWADAFIKGNLSSIQEQQGAFFAGGFFDIRNLFYSSKDLPKPIQNGSFKVQLENSGGIADKTLVNIPAAHIEVGGDPVDFSLQLRNPVSTADFSGTAKGRFTLNNIKQFVQLDPGTSITGVINADLTFSGNKSAIDKKEYEKINTAGSIVLGNLNYISKDYPGGIKIHNAKLDFTQNTANLNSLAGKYLKTNFTANGVINNLIGYTMHDQTLEGSLKITADKMNLNDWMGTDLTSSSDTSTASKPFQVPANIDFVINAQAGEVKYDKVSYNNIEGTILIKDETIKLQDVKTEALDGTITFDGTYSTRENKKQPDISINYDVKDVDVQKAFFAYNTVQKMMPVGKFLAGKLSSQLKMTGKLGSDMMPDLNSLTGNGNLLLIKGVLKKFQPLEKLANTLQIGDLKEISLKDIKNYIEFANGTVLVKPFIVKAKDIEMLIGGRHGFDQSLDYLIQMKLPRKYMGAGATTFMNNLATQAVSKGIPVKLGETVNLSIKMSGNILHPTIEAGLKEAAGDATKEMKQQAVDFANQKIESAKKTVKDSLSTVKKQVTKDLKGEVTKQLIGKKDSAKSNIPASLDDTKKKAGETIKGTLNNLFKKKKA